MASPRGCSSRRASSSPETRCSSRTCPSICGSSASTPSMRSGRRRCEPTRSPGSHASSRGSRTRDDRAVMSEPGNESLRARIAELERQLDALRGAGQISQPLLVVTSLVEGRILQATEAFARLAGYRRDEMLGRTTLELNLWRDPADRERAVQRLAAQGGRGVARFVIRRRDGTPCEVVGQVESVAMGGEQVVITALEEPASTVSPRSSRERDESLQFILGNAPLTFYTTDCDGVLTLSAGKALARLGLKPGELVGKSCLDLYGAFPVRLADGTSISLAEAFRRVMGGEIISGRCDLAG